MNIKAERMRIEEDTDNDLWLIDFRDEEKAIRGKIEIPSKVVPMEDIKEFEIDIFPREKAPASSTYSNAKIVYNATSFRTRDQDDEQVYSFSAGGLMLRLFSTKAISEFKVALREYVIVVK
ncbi:MAG: hypothetical protein EAX86_00465 [Candidatus Heimdallarchaeota archaeon]|nr:hypothetical protein [Candidatus Heimdallarchaeota archaeon]